MAPSGFGRSRKMTRLEQMQKAVKEYHQKHPEVWDAFERFTFDRIERGFKSYSVKAIFERIRWDMTDVGGDGVNEFKIGNNHPTFYARRFMKMYPQHEGFFRTRTQISAFSPARLDGEALPSDVQ